MNSIGDTHIHVVMDGVNYKAAMERHKQGANETIIREELLQYQKNGITFLRDGGDRYGACILAGKLAPEYGIDYRMPAFAIHKKGHYGGVVGFPFEDWNGYKDLVERVIDQGADFIKIMISGILDFSEEAVLTEDGLSDDEISDMIAYAHDRGMAVMAHCNGDRTCKAALEAGVDSLEHGYFMTDETIALLAEKKTVWNPTLSPIADQLEDGRFPGAALKANLDGQMDNIRKAVKLKCMIGLGSDAGAYRVPHDKAANDELFWLGKAGVSLDTLSAAQKRVEVLFKRS